MNVNYDGEYKDENKQQQKDKPFHLTVFDMINRNIYK